MGVRLQFAAVERAIGELFATEACIMFLGSDKDLRPLLHVIRWCGCCGAGAERQAQHHADRNSEPSETVRHHVALLSSAGSE
jgi:hypothetical protein